MDERKGLSAKNILVIVIVLILFVGGFFVTGQTEHERRPDRCLAAGSYERTGARGL